MYLMQDIWYQSAKSTDGILQYNLFMAIKTGITRASSAIHNISGHASHDSCGLSFVVRKSLLYLTNNLLKETQETFTKVIEDLKQQEAVVKGTRRPNPRPKYPNGRYR